MISRRQFLGGSIGIVLAGAAGAFELLEHPGLLHDLHLENSPDIGVPNEHVKTVSGELASKYLPAKARWSYALPTIPPVATVFCLHGRSGNHSEPFDDLRLPDIVAAARLPFAIAAIDGGEHSYWHKRADGTDVMSMLIDEFIPLVERATGTSKRALYGWSMGGYGVLLASETHPEMFNAIVALSPALWTKAKASAPGAFDGAADFAAHDVFAHRDKLLDRNVRISCGTSDPFYDATKNFVSGLPHAEVDFGKGFHDDAYWRSATPSALSFIATACL